MFQEEKIHPASLKYHVLLHDAAHGEVSKAESILQDMKKIFGPSACHLLVINSNEDLSAVHVPDLWSGVIERTERRRMSIVPEAASPTEAVSPESITEVEAMGPLSESLVPDEEELVIQYGRCLLEADIKRLVVGSHLLLIYCRIQTFVMEFTTSSLVPYLSQTINTLQQSVQAQRKKGGAFLRRWFGSGPKPSAPPTSQSAYNVPLEQQMRKLADYSFMLQDYDTSGSMYHSLKKDFSSEKAYKHYSGAQVCAH